MRPSSRSFSSRNKASSSSSCDNFKQHKKDANSERLALESCRQNYLLASRSSTIGICWFRDGFWTWHKWENMRNASLPMLNSVVEKSNLMTKRCLCCRPQIWCPADCINSKNRFKVQRKHYRKPMETPHIWNKLQVFLKFIRIKLPQLAKSCHTFPL